MKKIIISLATAAVVIGGVIWGFRQFSWTNRVILGNSPASN